MNRRVVRPMKRRRLLTALQTLLLSFAIILVTAATSFAVTRLISEKLEIKSYPQGIPAAAEELRALSVCTKNNIDFPSAPNLPAKELKAQLDQLAQFAHTYGYNAIFFEAVPECDAFYHSSVLPSSAYWTGSQGTFTFFDPLKYLTNITKEYGIQVYAVVDPFSISEKGLSDNSPAAKNPEWVTNGFLNPEEPGVQKLVGKVVDELTSRYDIGGVVLSEVDNSIYQTAEHYSESVARIAAHAHDAIQQKDVQRLGMVVNSDSILSDAKDNLAELPVRKGDLDFIVAASSSKAGSDALLSELSAWKELCASQSSASRAIRFYSLHAADDDQAFSHQIDDSLYLEREIGVSGTVISHYAALNTKERTAAYSLAATFSQVRSSAMPDLSYSRTFSIARPEQALTVDSSWESYFITGTSDPDKPLYYNGAEVKRAGKNGLWGVLVRVSYGTNSYVFEQDGVTNTATIIREQPGGTTPINTIVKSSAYPGSPEAVLYGQSLKLSCTAPSGGTVTATVAGITQALTQVSQAQNGMPATYQASLDLSPVAVPGQVKNVGAVTYQLNYAGMNNSQQSAGEVYAAGEGAVPVAKMKTFVVPVNQNAADDGLYATILKQGCSDYILENIGSYYKLSFGGYVLKNAVELSEGVVTAENTVSVMSMSAAEKGERLILSGTSRPAFTGALTDNTLTVTLYHIAGFENMNTSRLESRLCDSIESSVDVESGSVTLTFHLKETTELNGWDVQFQGNDMMIYLRQKPKLQTDSAKPLSNVTVVIDPGHGGSDPGAAGIPYHEGPWEKTLNLANAYALQSRLEALGATVTLTQEDETMTLNDRMALAQTKDADVFISCHHNALSETADGNNAAGIEVFYYNDQSKDFADQIGSGLSELTGRKLRFTEQSWYRVTMMTACPSVLVESGFLCNPLEYEEIASDFAMQQYANAVADAVIKLFNK